MNLSEKAYIHKVALRGHALIDAVLLAAYTLEWIKGSRTLGYYMIIVAFTVLPVVAEFIVYHQNKENTLIQHIMGVSYSSMYIFAIFTTSSQLPFVYCIPMYILITLFSNIPYCIAICIGGFLSNVVYVVYHAMTIGYTAEELPDVEIRIACMLLVGVYMIWTAIAMKHTNDRKIQRIQDQQNQANNVLHTLLNTSDSMIEGITEITEKMKLLGTSVEHMQISMEEVNTGSGETATSIQNQMERTEEIQKDIVTVRDTTQDIGDKVSVTAERVEHGRKQMELLSAHVEQSAQANEQVLNKMQELNEYTKQMNTIVDTITSIAGSTGMLALNASIEAARAGEAGRGFAVVADQISGLANQTKTATIRIASLIGNITKELEAVSQAVDVVTRSNQENTASTQAVTENFADIADGAEAIDKQTRELMRTVKSLEEANADIVDKIQTISAITEEVSAHSNETYDACDANSKLVEQVGMIVKQLNENAETLKAIR